MMELRSFAFAQDKFWILDWGQERETLASFQEFLFPDSFRLERLCRN